VYRIEDESTEWEFTRIKNEDDTTIVFKSVTPIPYYKRASDRLHLIWEDPEKESFQQEQRKVLRFANYTYKMVNEDNKELTPIYIRI